jgi:two-component system response regulator
MSESTVLVVDDNKDEAALTVYALSLAGVSDDAVKVADGGSDALDYLFGTGQYAGCPTLHLPHLMLLDLKMPGMGGLEVLRRLRQDEHTRRLPVVILTSSINPSDIINSYDAGANSYIRKPFELRAFTQTVQQLVAYWVHLNAVSAPERQNVEIRRQGG